MTRGLRRVTFAVCALAVACAPTSTGTDRTSGTESSSGTGAAAAGGGTTVGTAADVVCGTHATYAYASHPGVPADLTSLDVHLPPSAPDGTCTDRPLVIWVHGGAWTAGDKTEYIDDKVRLFGDAGFVFASVNYRLTDPDLVPPAPRHPVHDQDVADAVAWLLDHSAELGVDPTRVAVLGHSAGGGITAAITTDARYLGAHGRSLDDITCAASMDGEGYDVTAGATNPIPEVATIYTDAFGTDPAVWVDASPMTHVAAGAGIPEFFVAARGGDWRIEAHLRFVATLQAAGVPTTVLDSRELEHADLAVDVGAPDDTVVTPALMAFLDGCFAAG